MSDHRFDKNYLRQYARLPELLRCEPTPEVTEEALAFLCNREDHEFAPEAQVELVSLDLKFAQALASASDEWVELINSWANTPGWEFSYWWLMVRELSRQHAERLETKPAG